jgi:hypothetical protein
MLADPIIRAVMVRDGVTEQEVFGAIAKARGRMAGRQMKNREAGRRKFGSVLSIQGGAQKLSMPDERRLPWMR